MASILEELKAKVAAMEAHYANVAREDTDDNGDPLLDETAGAGAGLSEESDGDA